jgi:hypothetical protein
MTFCADGDYGYSHRDAEDAMDERTIEKLVERMGRLERQNRLLKFAGGAVLVGMFLVMASGAINDDNITCKFLTITGPAGEPRIKFFGGNANQLEGRVTMQILDANGALASETYWEPNGRTGRFVVYKNDNSGQIFRSIP